MRYRNYTYRIMGLIVLFIVFTSNQTPAKAIGSYGVDLSCAAYTTENIYQRPQCTWYCWGRAREKLGIWLPQWHNARYWADNASSQYEIGDEPRANSIMVENWKENGVWHSTGHVAFIEKIENGRAYFTHGNFLGSEYRENSFDISTKISDSTGTRLGEYLKFIYLVPQTGTLDVNGWLDGDSNAAGVAGYGTFDVYINGSLASEGSDVSDYWNSALPAGTRYEIKDIRATSGHVYQGVANGSSLSGTISAGNTIDVRLKFLSQYTISYNANGGSGAPASQTKTYGTALTLSSTRPTRTGYVFQGWATSASATSAAYQPGSSYTSNSAATLYAVWKPQTYTVTLNANGGTVSPSSVSVTYNSTYGNLPTPTRSGHVFDGWHTASTGGSMVTGTTKVTETNDHTLYAHWREITKLELSASLTRIEDEAFMGCASMSVVIPAKCEYIGSKAFANCGNLISVHILGKSTTFESDTFSGSPNVVIYCYSGSRAQRLASADGFEYHLIGVESDWVLVDNVPLGAEITDRKWTYTSREYTESSSASYTGWTQFDSKRTSWTDWSGWQNNEISGSSDREVRTQSIITGYNMISYCVSGPNGRSYQPSPTYTVRLQHGPYWWSKAELDSARVFSAGSYFDYASNVAGYVLDGTGYCKWDGSDTGGYIPMFIQDTTYGTQWSYRDAVYTYYYYRDLNKESATDPSGQDNVSNVQEWVKYIY